MSACWNLFWPLPDAGKRILEAAVLVLAAVVAAVVMFKVPPQPPSLPTGMHQFFSGLVNVMAPLYFASIREVDEWDCGGRMLLFFLLAMMASIWVTVYALPVVISWFFGDDLLWCLGLIIMHIVTCSLPAVVYVPFYTRGVDAVEKRKQARQGTASI